MPLYSLLSTLSVFYLFDVVDVCLFRKKNSLDKTVFVFIKVLKCIEQSPSYTGPVLLMLMIGVFYLQKR